MVITDAICTVESCFLKAVIEVLHLDAQGVGQTPNHGGRYPVCATFVLLDLLKSYAAKLSQLPLSQVQLTTALEDSFG